MIITELQSNRVINLLLHSLILFTFLYIFFTKFIAKKITESANDAMDDIIASQIASSLTNLEKNEEKLYSGSIKWEALENVAIALRDTPSVDLEVEQNNKKVKMLAMGIMVGMTVIVIGMYFLFTSYFNHDIHLKEILTENFIIFGLVGMLEAYFFLKVAFKYVPITPEFPALKILDRIKYRLNQQLLG